jgi:hypothetical protein
MESYPCTLEQLEQSIYSASPYIRWREANPGLAGTDRDVNKVHVQKMRDVLGGASETLDMAVKVVLIMFKKAS